MGLFREALLAMIPVAERARIGWREPHTYDDWDVIAEALFRSLVVMNIENADGWQGFAPFAPYDSSAASHVGKSYVGSPELGPEAIFARMATDAAPFDTCVFFRTDGRSAATETRTAFAKTRFAAFGRGRADQAALSELSVLL